MSERECEKHSRKRKEYVAFLQRLKISTVKARFKGDKAHKHTNYRIASICRPALCLVCSLASYHLNTDSDLDFAVRQGGGGESMISHHFEIGRAHV